VPGTRLLHPRRLHARHRCRFPPLLAPSERRLSRISRRLPCVSLQPSASPPCLGHWSFAFLFFFGIFTFEYCRRKHFELFYYTHYLFVGYLYFGVLHSNSVASHRGDLLALCFLSICQYAVDRLVRIYRGRVKSFALNHAKSLHGDAVQTSLTLLAPIIRSFPL
jgi:hypothetical protein